jgi:hypothetical protein
VDAACGCAGSEPDNADTCPTTNVPQTMVIAHATSDSWRLKAVFVFIPDLLCGWSANGLGLHDYLIGWLLPRESLSPCGSSPVALPYH